jgi:hypothetical protein
MEKSKFCSWEGRVGIYYILTKLPTWATFSVVFVLFTIIVIGRDILERFPYQVAYSAIVGEGLCFIAMTLIIATIMQRDKVRIPELLQYKLVHEMIVVWSVGISIICCMFSLESRSGSRMDIYHDVVMMSLIIYSAITLLPIIWFNGERYEKWAFWSFALLWGGCFIFDIIFGRINQFLWLLHHGVTLIR